MKKINISLVSIVLVCIIVAIACNKQSGQPENQLDNSASKPFQRKTIEVIRGKISSTTAVTMSIDVLGNETVITTVASSAQSTDEYGIFTPLTGVAVSNGEFTLTPNGTKWWLVPFDPTKNPIEIIAGGGANAKIACYCEQNGTGENVSNECSPKQVDNCTKCAPTSTSVCEDCDMLELATRASTTNPWAIEGGASYRFVNANAVRYNGTLYQ